MKHTPFSQEAHTIRLTAAERNALRERVVSYMEYHPLHTAHQASQPSVAAHLAGVLFGTSTRARSFVGALSILLLVAVPVAAERALPGDPLYKVKVTFNEGVRSQLAFSPYEKVVWETERVERRIAEARKLAEAGLLTKEAGLALEENVRKHTAAVKSQLAVIREQDAEGAAIAEVTLESAYDVQSAMLAAQATATTSASVSADRKGIGDIAAIVRAARDEVASSSASSTSSYDRLVLRIDENLTYIDALVANLGGELSDEQRASIAARTKEVRKDVERAKRDERERAVSVAALRESLATTQKLIAFMNNIDVRSRLSLDTLIPVRTSDAVRYAGLRAAYELLASEKEALSGLLARIPDGALRVEAQADLEALVELLGEVNEKLDAGDLDGAQSTLARAHALGGKLRVFAQQGGGIDPELIKNSTSSSTPQSQ